VGSVTSPGKHATHNIRYVQQSGSLINMCTYQIHVLIVLEMLIWAKLVHERPIDSHPVASNSSPPQHLGLLDHFSHSSELILFIQVHSTLVFRQKLQRNASLVRHTTLEWRIHLWTLPLLSLLTSSQSKVSHLLFILKELIYLVHTYLVF
jgi:hypothetical protein